MSELIWAVLGGRGIFFYERKSLTFIMKGEGVAFILIFLNPKHAYER